MLTSFDLWTSSTCGNKSNTFYPQQRHISCTEDLTRAALRDMVCAQYANNERSEDNFIRANVVPMDIDNDHSEDPAQWITFEKFAHDFSGVLWLATGSRNNGKEKTGTNGTTKAARPKFHVFFPVNEIRSAAEIAAIKKTLKAVYPYFDGNALDAARFFFGTNEKPETHDSEEYRQDLTQDVLNVVDWLEANHAEELTHARSAGETASSASENVCVSVGSAERSLSITPTGAAIHEGSRNKDMHGIACQLITKYGDSTRALQEFIAAATRCTPPLGDRELNSVYRSAAKSFHARIEGEWLELNEYIRQQQKHDILPPLDDLSDVAQSRIFVNLYGDQLRHVTTYGWIVWNGERWEEDTDGTIIRAKVHNLTDLQRDRVAENRRETEKGIEDILNGIGITQSEYKRLSIAIKQGAGHKEDREKIAAVSSVMDRVEQLQTRINSFEKYRKFLPVERNKAKIDACISEAAAAQEVKLSIDEMDADPFTLNTPAGEIDLRTGEIRSHALTDYCSHMTACSPGTGGKDEFDAFLNRLFEGDTDLQKFMQTIAGMIAVGGVYDERLIVAYGHGGNGKSTLFNAMAAALGSYSTSLPPAVLIAGNEASTRFEKAGLFHKRFVLLAESQEGERLSTSAVKQLTSTDTIHADRKMKTAIDFRPTHTSVFFTNHLPRCGERDEGSRRRLVIIPFRAKFTKQDAIMDYGRYIFENCGEALMQWIIDGAKRFIANGCKLDAEPQAVRDMLSDYWEDNDWFTAFLDECCKIGTGERVGIAELYDAYKAWTEARGEFCRKRTDFKYEILNDHRFMDKRTNAKRMIFGLSLM